MSNSRSVKNIMSIKALTNNDTDSIQYERNNNTNNNYNSNSNNDNANNKNYNFVFETFGQTDCNTVGKRKFNNRHLKEKEESVTEKKNCISKPDNNSIQESQIRILSAKELPNIATKPNAIILSHQVLDEMLEKNEHASSMFESVSNSWKKTDESVLAYNRNNSNNSLYRPNITSEASSSLPPSLTNTSSSSSSSSSSYSSHLYSLNNSNSNSNSNNSNDDSDDFADNQSKKNKNKNSSPQNEDDGKEKKPEGEKKKKKKNYNYKKKAYRLQNINKLKKPRNGYMIYMNEVYETVKSQHPELKFGELSTFIGRQWKSLSKEKQQPYHDRHEKEKIAYDNAKVAMGTSKLHIVEESIDDIMAKKSAISAFSNASFAAFTSSSPTPPPLQSLQMPPPPPLKSQLLPPPKNPIINITAINTPNVNNTNYNNNKIYNYNNNNNFLPTPPQTSPTTANITATTTNTTSSASCNLPSLFMTPTTLDKFSAPKIVKNESSDSEDSQFNATNNTITNNNLPPKRARIIFNENNDQPSLSMRTSTALTATTSTSSTEIVHSATKNKWHLPIEGTFTSPGLSPFRKRKVKNIHQDGDDDDDDDYNSMGGDQSPTSNNLEVPSSKVKKL